jgi:hypothetical protein
VIDGGSETGDFTGWDEPGHRVVRPAPFAANSDNTTARTISATAGTRCAIVSRHAAEVDAPASPSHSLTIDAQLANPGF